MAFGTKIHKCLEEFYKNGLHPVDVLADLYDEEIAALPDIDPVKSELVKESELGRVMLEGYLEWLEETGADSDLEVTDTEKKLTALLMNGRVELRGKVDMRVRRSTDNARMPFDFKTVAQFETYTKIAHMAEQLKLYLILENMNKDSEDDRVSGGKYRLLKKSKRTAKAKPPFYKDFDVRHNKKTLESYWISLHGILNNMLDLRYQLDTGADPKLVAYPTPSNDCSWKCPFYTACPMFDDGSAVEDFVHDYFVQQDPYIRYEEEEDD